jgi:hypothetical protein
VFEVEFHRLKSQITYEKEVDPGKF